METNKADLVKDLEGSSVALKKALSSIGAFNSELQKTVDPTNPEVIKYKQEVSDLMGKLDSENLLSKLDSAMSGLKNMSFGA